MEGLKQKALNEENKKLYESVAELREKLEAAEKASLNEVSFEQEEVENLKREVVELQQALLIDQEEKQRLLKERDLRRAASR